MNNQFNRTSLVIGTEGVDILKRSHVCVFGIGGVGGHCIEALARVGMIYRIDLRFIFDSFRKGNGIV